MSKLISLIPRKKIHCPKEHDKNKEEYSQQICAKQAVHCKRSITNDFDHTRAHKP